MNDRQRAVLNCINDGGRAGRYPDEIESRTGYPKPSIRRIVQELRAMKWNISFAGSGDTYVLAQNQRNEAVRGFEKPATATWAENTTGALAPVGN
jgi:DNA-binding IclR family transcriptional regulator